MTTRSVSWTAGSFSLLLFNSSALYYLQTHTKRYGHTSTPPQFLRISGDRDVSLPLSLEWPVWSSSSGNSCHAVHRSLSSGASLWSGTFTLSHIISRAHLRFFFRLLTIGMCHFRYLRNGRCDRHRAEITIMQFIGHSLPVHLFFLRQSENFFYLVSYCEPSCILQIYTCCRKNQQLRSQRYFNQIMTLRSGNFILSIDLFIPNIGMMVRVFANAPEDRGSIQGRVMPKTLKMVLDTYLLNTQRYKVGVKGKVEQSRERSCAFPYTSV